MPPPCDFSCNGLPRSCIWVTDSLVLIQVSLLWEVSWNCVHDASNSTARFSLPGSCLVLSLSHLDSLIAQQLTMSVPFIFSFRAIWWWSFFWQPRSLEVSLPSGNAIFVSRLATFPTHSAALRNETLCGGLEDKLDIVHWTSGRKKKGQGCYSLLSLSGLTTDAGTPFCITWAWIKGIILV